MAEFDLWNNKLDGGVENLLISKALFLCFNLMELQTFL